MFSYLGGKDASSCIIQLSTEDPDSQKEQTTNLPSLHNFVVSLAISRPISPRGGGGGAALPYITYMGMCRPTGS